MASSMNMFINAIRDLLRFKHGLTMLEPAHRQAVSDLVLKLTNIRDVLVHNGRPVVQAAMYGRDFDFNDFRAVAQQMEEFANLPYRLLRAYPLCTQLSRLPIGIHDPGLQSFTLGHITRNASHSSSLPKSKDFTYLKKQK